MTQWGTSCLEFSNKFNRKHLLNPTNQSLIKISWPERKFTIFQDATVWTSLYQNKIIITHYQRDSAKKVRMPMHPSKYWRGALKVKLVISFYQGKNWVEHFLNTQTHSHNQTDEQWDKIRDGPGAGQRRRDATIRCTGGQRWPCGRIRHGDAERAPHRRRRKCQRWRVWLERRLQWRI